MGRYFRLRKIKYIKCQVIVLFYLKKVLMILAKKKLLTLLKIPYRSGYVQQKIEKFALLWSRTVLPFRLKGRQALAACRLDLFFMPARSRP